MASLQQAIDHLKAGRWQDAHVIAQEDESTLGSWAHGIVHILEGDLANAQYWYRKAKRTFPGADHVAEEIAMLEVAARDQ